jgi:hypothetical protein
MSDRAQDTLVTVLRDEIPGVCPDVEEVREATSLQEAWSGALDYELDPRLWRWFVDVFVTDARERYRIHRTLYEVRAFFFDLARLHYIETGEATRPDERLIRGLQQRLIATGLHPSAYEVATGAVKGPAGRASSQIAKLTEVEAWQKRSSS